MARLLIPFAILCALLLPGVARADVLPISYAHNVTRDVAKRLDSTTRDAEKYGVSGCKRDDNRNVRCQGFVRGHSLDNNAVKQPWRCIFSARYTLTKRSGGDFQGHKVKADFSKAHCSGRGAPFIQRLSILVISLRYMHDQTARTARQVENRTHDARKSGVDRCWRKTNLRGRCVGYIKGASVDPKNTKAGGQHWRCTFVERFRVTDGQHVHSAIGRVTCVGPGKDFIKRPSDESPSSHP
jgi:hypothetical protein